MMITPFDLTFGISPDVVYFASAFTERPALSWLDWPDWMIEDGSGGIIPIMKAPIFKGFFDYILSQYWQIVPDGRLKFNLAGLNADHADSMTTWELQKISSVYPEKVDYYWFQDRILKPLDSQQAASRLKAIQISV